MGHPKTPSIQQRNIVLWMACVAGGIALFTSVMAQTLADAAPHHAQRILAGLTRPVDPDCGDAATAVLPPAEANRPASAVPAVPVDPVHAVAVPGPPAATDESADEIAKDDSRERAFACPVRDQGYDQLLWRQDGHRVFPRGCL